MVQEACSDVERACQTRAVIEVSNPGEDLERITEGSMWAVSDLAAPDMHRGTLLLRASARSHWQPLASHTGPQPYVLLSRALQIVMLKFDFRVCFFFKFGFPGFSLVKVVSRGTLGGSIVNVVI